MKRRLGRQGTWKLKFSISFNHRYYVSRPTRTSQSKIDSKPLRATCFHLLEQGAAQQEHAGGRQRGRYRHRHHPSGDDVPEQLPVDPLARGAQVADENYRADLAVGCRDRQADLGGQQHCERRTYLDREAPGTQV